jgi:ComF family protein
VLCGRCLRSPPPYDRVHAGALYRFPADAILRRYKYAADFSLAPLAAAILRAALTTAARPDVILPAPLHPAKLRDRGFNQASEVARRVGRALDVRVDTTALVRCRATVPQAGLDRQQRRANMHEAFAVRRGLQGHVAVLDDVMTSGATAAAMASAVRAAGAESVSVWVVMRTPSGPDGGNVNWP